MAIGICRTIFLKKLWPDFNSSDLKRIINNFKKVKEILELYEINYIKKKIFTSIFLLLLTFLIFKFVFVMVLSLLILGIFSILEFINLSKKIFKNSFYYYLFNFLFITFVSIFSFLFFFLKFSPTKIYCFNIAHWVYSLRYWRLCFW